MEANQGARPGSGQSADEARGEAAGGGAAGRLAVSDAEVEAWLALEGG